MPAVCSICYHSFKHKYGMDKVSQTALPFCSSGDTFQEAESEVRVCISSVLACQEELQGRVVAVQRIQEER